MKLLIDALPLLTPLTGIGKYTYEISKEAKKHFNTTFFYGFYSKRLILSNLAQVKKNPLIKRIARKIFGLTNKFSSKDFDLYFQPNFILDKNIQAKIKVATIHDFSFLNKNWHPKERYEYFNKNFFPSIKEADYIITVSNFIKEEIKQKLNFDENKIKVIYNGVDHNIFKPYETKSNFLPNLPKKYLLYIGSIEPRKNLIRLLKAYNLLDKHIKKEFSLVLVGAKGWQNSDIFSLIEKNKDFIHYFGYLDDITLAKVYTNAYAFIYPSLYEGFGIPPIEAMSCKTPVLTSKDTVMQEVCKENALYFDPYDEDDIKQKLLTIIQDLDLRNSLANKGYLHSQNFSWQKTADEHINFFKQISSSL